MTAPLHFGHFEVRLDQRQLLVRGRPATLGSRAFEVLRALVERRDRLVSKDELLELVWPGVIVEENNLQVQVSALRKLLGSQVIATIPGRGYQFTAVLSVSSANSGPPTSADPAASSASTEPGRLEPLSALSAAEAKPTGAPLARSAAGPRGRLLVADDNKVNRLLLCRTLELMGHQVASVENGRKALEALRRERHDLMLLDLEMPELDGLAVLAELARDPELHDLPVIVTSSVDGVAQVARCVELGAEDFLHKPVNPVLLKARVESSLDKRRLREQQKALVQRLNAALAAPGTAGSPRPTRAQCRNATVLAVRLRASGAAEPAADPQEAIALLDSCHTLWRDAIASHGGVAFDGSGEGLMAVFGIVAAASGSGDDEGAVTQVGAQPVAEAIATPPPAAVVRLAATRAALEMAEMFDVLNAERAVSGQPPLALHIGVASGEVLSGHAGHWAQASPQARLHCVGAPVRLALALQAHAQARALTLLVDGATQSALRGRIATEPVAELGPPDSGGEPMEMFAAVDPLSRAPHSA